MTVNLSKLNTPQREAVTHGDGPLLVLAGAGSGKTRVVTYRTAYLLDLGVPADRVLVVTFTNKAAGEMRERILTMVGSARGAALTLTTFHSFGARLLREHIERLGYRRSFTILDEADQRRLVGTALEELGLKGSGAKPDEVLRIISRAKRAQTTPARLKAIRTSPLLPHASRVFGAYQSALRALNGVDFDDLIVLPIQLCRDHPEVRAAVTRRFRYVMVDEFQDTNGAQLALLRAVLGEGDNVMAVGDDDQSIYGFQGAQPENILAFDRHFPGAKVVKLEQSYRSTRPILEAANAVIANNRGRYEKVLWSERRSRDRIRFVSCADEREEAAFVASDIEAQRERGGLRYGDVAVLYRINPQAKLFEEVLQRRGVPHRVRGATALFDRTEVRDWVAYLGLLANPTNELHLRRVLNVPRRGLGTVAVAELTRLAETRKTSLLTALRSAHSLSRLTAEGRQGAAELVALLDRYARRLRKARGVDLAEASRAYLQATGLVGHIRRVERNPQSAEERIAHLQMLVEGMAERPDQSLVDYLSDLAIEARSAGRAGHREGRDVVTLMTLHSSKGLEFSHVYLVGFEKGLLPHQRSLKRAAAIAEERRLCYVGMTRAKDRLTLTAARTRTRRSERLPRQPSPFLAEIPDELLDRSGEPETLTGVRRERNRRNLSKIYEILGVEPE